MSTRLEAIKTELRLQPSGKPGEWVKPDRGINMNAIPLDKIPVEQKPRKHEEQVVTDGTSESGILALRRSKNLRNRMARILASDRRAIGRQEQLEDEAAQLAEEMRSDPGLRRDVEGVVRRLPPEEQAYVRRLLRERGSPEKQIRQNIDALRAADAAKGRLLSSGYRAVGGAFGDAMVVTDEGVQIFAAGMGRSEDDTTPDAAFPFDAVISGRLTFAVAGQDGKDRRPSRRRGGWLPQTVLVTDTLMGKTYHLRGVRDPYEFIEHIFGTAQAVSTGDHAATETVQLLREHPEMLE